MDEARVIVHLVLGLFPYKLHFVSIERLLWTPTFDIIN